MSFRLFIYYCALGGGWAAFLCWALALILGLHGIESVFLRTALIGALLGLLVAGAVGAFDALLNASGFQRIVRIGICLGIGLVGGFVGSAIGQLLVMASRHLLFVGWMLTGIFIGASIGIFDLVDAIRKKHDTRLAKRKVINGVYGGLLGGSVGGIFFQVLLTSELLPVTENLRSGLTLGLVILGLSIGLLVGLAQVFLKEAWLKVEAGFRPGREILLSKDETTIGRAESCDIGLFGDRQVEKLHARIQIKHNRYYLSDVGNTSGTFVNEQRVGESPVALSNGDAIKVGSSVLRFGEREKRR